VTKLNRYAAITVLALAGFTGHATAANVFWTGVTNNQWNLATNWDTAVAASADVAIFNSDGNGNTTLIVANQSVQGIRFASEDAAAYVLGTTPGAGTIIFNETGSQSDGLFMNMTTVNHQVINSNLVLGTDDGDWEHAFENNSANNAILTVAGNITPGGFGKEIKVKGTGDMVISGDIIGGGFTPTIYKTNAGTLTLTGAFTDSGNTYISEGTVLFNGTHSGSGGANVEGGTLGGTGEISGPVIVEAGANLAPGTSTVTASLAVNGFLNLKEDATLAIKLGGTTFDLSVDLNIEEEEYDRVRVLGFTALAGNLAVSLINGHMLGDGDLYGILHATSGRNGVFANFAEGDVVLTQGQFELRITYEGHITDDSVSLTGGNDVVLYAQLIPEPHTIALLAAGTLLLQMRRRHHT
jgi:autotransporter-associated beta strand protein